MCYLWIILFNLIEEGGVLFVKSFYLINFVIQVWLFIEKLIFIVSRKTVDSNNTSLF